MTTHQVSCNVAEADCGDYWYEPGYKSDRSGCCHCYASCADGGADGCTYYDADRYSMAEEATTAPGATDDMEDACKGSYNDDGDLTATSAGSCYDMSTHIVECNVDEDTCTGQGGSYYKPGYVSGYSNCCHCAASCGGATEPTPPPTPAPVTPAKTPAPTFTTPPPTDASVETTEAPDDEVDGESVCRREALVALTIWLTRFFQ